MCKLAELTRDPSCGHMASPGLVLVTCTMVFPVRKQTIVRYKLELAKPLNNNNNNNNNSNNSDSNDNNDNGNNKNNNDNNYTINFNSAHLD